ncbi:Oligopeptide-binding protein OppA [Neochlamydia sp. TUME1]|uniref:peptide ABC transporter substrate-binding protein n=1 Tax=Neochlamydia sp. TUME1 TaxID=1478174 RepID=UPI00057C9317|nr:peptide ABC transporter substrate-binding protein [Neochlamydia sp. TUME1]KIC76455.1 Oligopeptide-binding protein OppA [Neochlamydia sp. TUME1]
MKENFSLLALIIFLLSACQNEKVPKKQEAILRLACEESPSSMDPRYPANLITKNLLHMLYEGLMKIDHQGNVIPAVALSVEVSADLKTYTFVLKDTKWSDGTPLTAKDFEQSWMSVLLPSFPSKNLDLLYIIKGAKAFKEGSGSAEAVGIKALDSKHLMIQLENPTPYFLKAVTTPLYFPVHPSLGFVQKKENCPLVTNGPFKVREWKPSEKIVLVKNSSYWDAKVVAIDAVVLSAMDGNKAYKMFERGKVDYVGSPLSHLPLQTVPTLKHQELLKLKPAAIMHGLHFNTKTNFLSNVKIRKAFNMALNRKVIAELATQGTNLPATGIIPPLADWEAINYSQDNDLPAAWQLFQEALQEMEMDKDSLPQLTLTYANTDMQGTIAQAVQQQWNHAFGFTIQLQKQEPEVFAQSIEKGDYQITLNSWGTRFSDPLGFLENFNYKIYDLTLSQNENAKYLDLLASSYLEKDSDTRRKYLENAEKLLMDSLPIAPLLFGSFPYAESENLGGIGLSDIGILDIKYAFLKDINEGPP